jgi:hypothetical protein
MLKINDCSNYMLKSSFDIPNPTLKKPKKYIIVQDNLFFSLYMKVNKSDEFEMKEYNETTEKIKIAECLEKIKFKNKEEIINNLVYEKVINLDTFNILVMFYKINLIFIKGRTYVKMKYGGDSDFLYMNDKGVYLENVPNTNIDELLEINIEKPLRTVSFYKLTDLQDMSIKLNIEIEKKKKQELYESIKMVLSSLYKFD